VPRYIVLPNTPRAEWWEANAVALPHPQVFPTEPTKTGLLNANGHDIYKAPDAIGFVRLKE
jgi:hypothetical protein